MDTLSEEQHGALAFVASATRGGCSPTVSDLDAWAAHHRRKNVGGLSDLRSLMESGSLWSGRIEPLSDHLLNLRWITRDGSSRLRLTMLGEALLKDANIDDTGVRTIVFGAEDPLAYASLIGELSKAGDGLLVDPYLDVEGLYNVVERTTISRVLIGDKLKPHQIAALQVFWKGTDGGVDVRVGANLHDRVVLAANGEAWAIGASLNTVAKKKAMTVLTPVLSGAVDAIRNQYEDAYKNANPLVPVEPALAQESEKSGG